LANDPSTTPTATDGDTATESDALVTEPEEDLNGHANITTSNSGTFTPPKRTASTVERKRIKGSGTTQHDLLNKYFRRDTVLLHNVDLFR
jgi:phosphatidylethanolamine N-methyltransferase